MTSSSGSAGFVVYGYQKDGNRKNKPKALSAPLCDHKSAQKFKALAESQGYEVTSIDWWSPPKRGS